MCPVTAAPFCALWATKAVTVLAILLAMLSLGNGLSTNDDRVVQTAPMTESRTNADATGIIAVLVIISLCCVSPGLYLILRIFSNHPRDTFEPVPLSEMWCSRQPPSSPVFGCLAPAASAVRTSRDRLALVCAPCCRSGAEAAGAKETTCSPSFAYFRATTSPVFRAMARAVAWLKTREGFIIFSTCCWLSLSAVTIGLFTKQLVSLGTNLDLLLSIDFSASPCGTTSKGNLTRLFMNDDVVGISAYQPDTWYMDQCRNVRWAHLLNAKGTYGGMAMPATAIVEDVHVRMIVKGYGDSVRTHFWHTHAVESFVQPFSDCNITYGELVGMAYGAPYSSAMIQVALVLETLADVQLLSLAYLDYTGRMSFRKMVYNTRALTLMALVSFTITATIFGFYLSTYASFNGSGNKPLPTSPAARRYSSNASFWDLLYVAAVKIPPYGGDSCPDKMYSYANWTFYQTLYGFINLCISAFTFLVYLLYLLYMEARFYRRPAGSAGKIYVSDLPAVVHGDQPPVEATAPPPAAAPAAAAATASPVHAAGPSVAYFQQAPVGWPIPVQGTSQQVYGHGQPVMFGQQPQMWAYGQQPQPMNGQQPAPAHWMSPPSPFSQPQPWAHGQQPNSYPQPHYSYPQQQHAYPQQPSMQYHVLQQYPFPQQLQQP